MKRSEKNKANRSKQRYPSYHGSESYSQKRWTEMEKHGTTSIVDGWKKTHYKPELGWANDLAEQDWCKQNWEQQMREQVQQEVQAQMNENLHKMQADFARQFEKLRQSFQQQKDSQNEEEEEQSESD
ncbi:hypothetical protein R6Q57_011858 [Mikania cordata]